MTRRSRRTRRGRSQRIGAAVAGHVEEEEEGEAGVDLVGEEGAADEFDGLLLGGGALVLRM